MTTLTQAMIASKVTEETGLGRADVDNVSGRMFELIRARLELGETVKLSGFATLEVRSRGERPGRNPLTGEIYTITARHVVHLVPGGKLQRKMANPPTS